MYTTGSSNDPPTVTLTAPVTGSSYEIPTEVTLSATAGDTDGTVTKVEFFADGSLVATATAPADPFTAVWSSVPAGTYAITATATDDGGGQTTSATATITVTPAASNSPPSVSLTAPVTGSSYEAPAEVTLSATAGDTDGTVTKVEFFADGSLVATATAPADPFTAVWSSVPAGTYAITATATDDGGGQTTSATATITVTTPPSNSPPSVSLTAPVTGSSYEAPAEVTLGATATDSDGTIAQVEFFANGSLVGSQGGTGSSYSVPWTVGAPGPYDLTAVATDNLGLSVTSTPVSVTITDPPPAEGVNVALAVNGGTATASSTYSPSYAPSAANNGDRSGAVWGAGGAWSDNGSADLPDWLRIDFDRAYTVDEVNVFSLQANAGNPVEPTPTLTSDSALEDFEVQFWDGAEWLGVPGGRVVGNLLVWSRVVFPAITTSSIRILVTQVAAGRSRLAEVEVYTMATLPPTVTLTAPTEGTDFQAPAMITLSADADDPDGTVTEVEFYANGTLVGSAESPTFTAVWSNVPDGTHSLTARAIDDSLAEATSIPVTVVVTQGGDFNVAAAANGATATASSTYSAS